MSAQPGAPLAYGLAAALSWGVADFTGGLVSRRASVYGVVIGAELAGLAALGLWQGFAREPLPAASHLLVCAVAGVAGGAGIVLLYRALAEGQMSIAAPVSAVLGAALPVLASAFQEGLPGLWTAVGLVLALVAIGLISLGEGGLSGPFNWGQLRLPLLAGITFGLYFILIHHASQAALLWPIITARISSVVFLITFAVLARRALNPGRAAWLPILIIGLLDTAGNVLYVLSGQQGRLDIAAVVSSLYPGATVLLAWLVLKERVTRWQLTGILAALCAIVLISL